MTHDMDLESLASAVAILREAGHRAEGDAVAEALALVKRWTRSDAQSEEA